MILPVPFWVISIFTKAITIVLSGAVGAAMAFYVKHSQDDYASSIRWSRTGGLLEMIEILHRSRPIVERRSCAVMSIMICASLFTSSVSSILSAMVSPTDNAVSPTPFGAITQQLMSSDPMFWTALMDADSTMEETLTLTLNDSRRNPNLRQRTRYIPRTYDYDIACKETTVAIGRTLGYYLITYPTANFSCKAYHFTILDEWFFWDPKDIVNRTLSPDTYMDVTPVITISEPGSMWFPEPVLLGSNSNICFRNTLVNLAAIFFDTFPKDGMVAPPRTDATKCQFGSDESLVLSATFIKFAINHSNDFDKVATSFFDDPTNLPLLQSMSAAIKNGTFLNPTNNATMVMLTKLSANVDFLMCISTFIEGQDDMGLLCTYLVTTMISIKPQQWDPVMVADLKRDSSAPVAANATTSQLNLAIHHFSAGAKSSNSSYSAAHLIKATTDAAEYLASLGHNVFVNREAGAEAEQLYILYDTVKLEDAFEIPTVALFVLLTVVVVCAIAWVISEMFYDPVYNDSLYKVIFQEIRSKEETTPMLMTCARDPLTFEGNQVVPPNEGEQPDGIATSQDVPLLPFDKKSTQQQPTQQAWVLNTIPAQSPLLVSSGLLARSPTITSVTVATNTNNQYLPETASRLSSQPTCPAIPPPIPPRPPLPFQESGVTFGPFVPPSTSIQKSHPRASNQSTQAPQPQSPPPNEKSTLIQNPFW